MFRLKMINFCKSVNCPASQKLLAFQNGEVRAKERKTISKHLAACEFCSAEVEFYAHYPQTDEEVVAKAEIPTPLFELASALLDNKHKDFSLLNQLLCQNEGVKV
jgi:anti-sigma factor RsiW